MIEKNKKTCKKCGRAFVPEDTADRDNLLCSKCIETDKTVIADETIVFDNTDESELGKTVFAGDKKDGEKTVFADQGTVALNETLASEQEETIASIGSESLQGSETVLKLGKSFAATKIIREVLKINPDVDLENASKIYLHKKGKTPLKDSESSINDLIKRSQAENKYIFEKELGRGGMGAVFATVDQDVRRKVAMKVMLPSAHKSTQHIKRFLEEAQVTGQLEHPNIVPIHDIGIDEESKIYFTMKLVKGENLESIINTLAEGKEGYAEKYSLGAMIQMFMKVCDGVGYAHSKGVLHRDLKPENIMIGDFGEAVVMDWGLAKVMGRQEIQTSGKEFREDDASSLVTLEGQVMGTPAYMSPEQANGKISELDERSDVFSLGAILYKILTLQAPYKAKTMREVLEKARKRILQPTDVIAPERHIPAELAAICMKALSRQKEERYNDALDMKKDIQLYLDGRSVSAKKDNILIKTKKWIMRNKLAAAGTAAAIICLIAGIALNQLYEEKKRQDTIANLLQQAETASIEERYEEAEERYFAVLGLDMDSDQARRGIAKVSGKAQAERNKRLAKGKIAEARQFFEQGNYIKAYDSFMAAFTLDPASEEVKQALGVAAVRAERQKAQEKILPILEETHKLVSDKKKLDGEISSIQANIDKIRRRIQGHEDFNTKKPLWDEEKKLMSIKIEQLSTEGKIISNLSTILGYDGEHSEARKSLAKIYYQNFKEAENLNDQQQMAYQRELVLAFDDGYFEELLKLNGTVTVTTVPKADSYHLFKFVEGPDRRLVPAGFSPIQSSDKQGMDQKFNSLATAFKPIGETLYFSDYNRLDDTVDISLPKGSYIIIARKKNYVDTRIPVLVKRGETTAIENIRLIKKDDIPQGFVYIPKGDFIMGGDTDAMHSTERQVRSAPGYLIAKNEVSVKDYLKFVNYMEARLPGSAEKYLPRQSATAGFYWKKRANIYYSDFPDDWPVLGISWNDARAYCRWMTLQYKEQGWEFRLPEEWEWEKAARGVDGRAFPWGNHFDFRFCSMANSIDGKRDGPSPVGSFNLDESVYGVFDLAGNVSEWCQSFFDEASNIRINKGSAWSFIDPSFARPASRNGHSPADVSDSRGFRMAVSIKN